MSTFLTGATAWAGSDAALADNEVEQSKSVCASGTAFDIPVYISPIAVVFNLQGVSGKGKTLNMDAETIAKIFDGNMTKWNDDAIKKQNPRSIRLTSTSPWCTVRQVRHHQELPELRQGRRWRRMELRPRRELAERGRPGRQGHFRVISTVQQADGTIGYADASQAGDLGTVAVKVGDDYVPFAEAAAKVVDASPLDDSAKGDNRVVVKLDHNTTEKGAYP